MDNSLTRPNFNETISDAYSYPRSPTVMNVSACPNCPASQCASLSKELTSQCTDQCVVVSCDDPTHNGTGCPTVDGRPICDQSTDCTDCSSFDQFLQCCLTDVNDHHQSVSWDPTLEAFFCACGANFAQEDNTFKLVPPPFYSEYPQIEEQKLMDNVQLDQSATFPCMWADCHASFRSMLDLVDHVNLHHLRLPAVADGTSLQKEELNNMYNPSSLSCLWRECQDYCLPDMIPSGSHIDNTLDILASHLLRDHIGLPVRTPSPPTPIYDQAIASGATVEPPQVPTLLNDYPSSTESVTPPGRTKSTTPPGHTCSGTHICHWISCGYTFESCDELTEHLSIAHVGSGKAHYDCYWENCTRNGAQGFSSKQKICRHLQSHTGHRPFQCTVCHQNFSEAATLQQHMRRHTQEKPYACDFPGCGKSFAITGALTIHKRIHNGEKPFKCSYCDKAFAESSNLSKHLRTHTGARPYSCAYAGCGKSFARPDQLNRHMSVHNKKTR